MACSIKNLIDRSLSDKLLAHNPEIEFFMNTNRQTFDRQLDHLRDEVLQMSEIVEQAILLSSRALQQHDLSLAREIDNYESRINAQRFIIEEHAYQLLALQQPNAKDMRQIVAGVSVVTNLERIGDHCAGVARLVIRLGDHPVLESLPELEQMALTGQWLTRNAMTAFASADDELAQRVIARDGEIDALHEQVYRQLISRMTQDATTIEAGTLLLWVSHNFERIGDRAANIARRVPYLVKGELLHTPEADA